MDARLRGHDSYILAVRTTQWKPSPSHGMTRGMGARPPKYDWPTIWPDPKKLTRGWLALILFVLAIPAIFVIGRFMIAVTVGDSADVRNIGFILVAVIGAPFVVWRSIVAQGNLDRSKDRDYADLFTKAVEQLGVTREVKRLRPATDEELANGSSGEVAEELTEANIEVRLGAIYALDRIGRESEKDKVAVMETLCAYVRSNAGKVQPIRSANDVNRAALKILFCGDGEGRIDINRISIDHLTISDVSIKNVCAERSYFANFQILGCDASHSMFPYATFVDSFIIETDLSYATLYGAVFSNTSFIRCNLLAANACGADFSESEGLLPVTLETMFGDAETMLPEHLEAFRPSHWATQAVEHNFSMFDAHAKWMRENQAVPG